MAILIGLVLEFFLFSVDYSRTEHIQYEDDEYYYYVKAVPKMSVAAPEKMVKRINERRNPDEKESEEEPEEKIELPKSEAIGTSLGDLFKNLKL